DGRTEPVGPRAGLAAGERSRGGARNADARGSLRPARAGPGDGRQLQTDVGNVCVVGRTEQGWLRALVASRDANSVIASEAKQSRLLSPQADWIASSLCSSQ